MPGMTLPVLLQRLAMPTVDAALVTWDGPVFILRSAPMDRLQALLRVVRAAQTRPALHILGHVKDEAAVNALTSGECVFYPYPNAGPYRLEDIPPETLDRLRSAGFGALLFLDAGTGGAGLDEVRRLMAAIDEPRVFCYRADGAFARPADWRQHRLPTAAYYQLIDTHRLTLDPGFPDGPVTPDGAVVMRPRPRVLPGTGGRSPGFGERPQYFLVTSQGLAGSVWLASSLNLHPDITCGMGIDHSLVSMRYYYNRDLIQTKTEAVRHADDIRHGFYEDNLRQHFNQTFAALGVELPGTLIRENPIRQLQHLYDELEWFEPRSTYYGNVHVCFAHEAVAYLKASPARRDVRVVNLIRHPVPRTEAAINNITSVATNHSDSDWIKGLHEGINAFAEIYAEGRRDIEKRFGIDFRAARNRAVLYSYYRAQHNDSWAGEITGVPDTCHVVLERLMTDRDYFAWLVWELTGREALASTDFLDGVHAEEHLLSGRHTGHGRGRSMSPRAQYNAWTEWERHEFRQVMRRLDLAGVYAPFGYDFSFVG